MKDRIFVQVNTLNYEENSRLALSVFLDNIASLQSGGKDIFPPGLFPAYRYNQALGYRRPDTNIFFSTISAFTLQSIRSALSEPTLQAQIDRILEGIRSTYPLFQNKDGLPTYNFWKTRPSAHFPNGYLLGKFEHFRIADDADDTAMVYLTTHRSRSECIWLHNKLAQHANGTSFGINNTFEDCKELPAYSTWFGKQMEHEFDACVLSNVLYFVYENKLPFSIHDEASLLYLRNIIKTGRFKTAPYHCAHHYPRTPLIIYHIARLIGKFNPLLLQCVKKELITATEELLRTNLHPMDRVILSTSLLRLGVYTQPVPVNTYTRNDFKGFWFFIAGILTACKTPILYKIAHHSVFHMYWESEAHCWVLLAEYQSLLQQHNH